MRVMLCYSIDAHSKMDKSRVPALVPASGVFTTVQPGI